MTLEGIFKERAKENQGTRTDLLQKSAKSLNPIDTKKELAKRSCISVEATGIYKMLSEAAEERKKASIPEKGQKGFQASVVQLIAPHKNPEDNKTRTVVAKAFNTNRTYVDGQRAGSARC